MKWIGRILGFVMLILVFCGASPKKLNGWFRE